MMAGEAVYSSNSISYKQNALNPDAKALYMPSADIVYHLGLFQEIYSYDSNSGLSNISTTHAHHLSLANRMLQLDCKYLNLLQKQTSCDLTTYLDLELYILRGYSELQKSLSKMFALSDNTHSALNLSFSAVREVMPILTHAITDSLSKARNEENESTHTDIQRAYFGLNYLCDILEYMAHNNLTVLNDDKELQRQIFDCLKAYRDTDSIVGEDENLYERIAAVAPPALRPESAVSSNPPAPTNVEKEEEGKEEGKEEEFTLDKFFNDLALTNPDVVARAKETLARRAAGDNDPEPNDWA